MQKIVDLSVVQGNKFSKKIQIQHQEMKHPLYDEWMKYLCKQNLFSKASIPNTVMKEHVMIMHEVTFNNNDKSMHQWQKHVSMFIKYNQGKMYATK